MCEYKTVLERILLTVEEAYRAERMFHCAVEKGDLALRSIYKTDLFKGMNAIFSSLGFNFTVAVQRLLQGDDKATLSGLLKASRDIISTEDYNKMYNQLDTLRASETAENLKEMRDSFLAHNALDVTDKKSTMITQEVLDLLFEISEWVEAMNKLAGFDQHDVFKSYNEYHVIADLTWHTLDIQNIHRKKVR